MNVQQIAHEFFASYAEALLERNAQAIAEYYAVPGLIVAPDQLIAISGAAQSEAFFASAFSQYDGVTTAVPTVTIAAATAHTIWADVTWEYDAAPAERNMYQLVAVDESWRIAVMTPLDVQDV